LSARSAFTLLVVCAVAGSTGCWEQIDDGKWFPQMKRQIAVQAYEPVEHRNQLQGFTPPEGSVPITGGEAPVSNVIDAEADVLVNPVPSDLRSLENGRALYDTTCAVCHGATGLADGPVAPVFAGVLPLVGVVKARSDGHIYTTIRYGRRRMPGYGRIPAQDRWDIVNYVRYLDQKGGQP
jgi:mono/diheme cytochrome c family protein